METTAFGSLLKDWRGSRHLSQLDLSLNAEISQRHISFLESGRSKPSREMVFKLSECLGLPLRERNAMLVSANFSPVYSQCSLNDPEMAAVKHALEMTLDHHLPYPAVVADRSWNVLMKNSALDSIFKLLGNPDKIWQAVGDSGDHNLLRLTCHPLGLRQFCSNWEVVAPLLLGRTRREAQLQRNTALIELVDEIASWEGISEQWLHLDESMPVSATIPLSLVIGGFTLNLFSMISTFGTAHDVTAEEIRVETFFPADDASKALLHSLA